jgi:hypothetical protein
LSEVCRITVPIDPLYTSENRIGGASRAMRRIRIQQVKDACGWAWIAAGSPKAGGPVILHLVVRRLAKMDQNNIWGGLKWAIDALFKGRVTPDDNEKHLVCGHIEQQVGEQYRHKPEVVFIVETLE